MTHEETIKRIQKLVPSVMALEFGCVLKNGTATSRVIKERFDGTVMINDWGGWQDKKMIEENFEILGKPITLATVLQAIEKVNTIEKENYCVIPNGGICHMGYVGRYYHQDTHWNLSKDNFNDQSEETKTFIGGLLTNSSQEE